MIQVTNENNQLKVVTNGNIDYYLYSDIKSMSAITEHKFRANQVPEQNYVLLINFINENKNSPLRIPMNLVSNQATWYNTQAGVNTAQSDLSTWSNAALNNQTVATSNFMTSAIPPTYTSGALVINKLYTMDLYVAGDDFTNVGAVANATGQSFIATGTTPTTWTNSSVLSKGSVGDAIDTWNAADDFTSEAILFPISEAWALQVVDYSITPGTPTLSIEVSLDGVAWSAYKAAATNIDITSTANRVIFDSVMPFQYFRVVYSSGGSTGSFSLLIQK